ncbi:MAG: GntR family transcriptional regulator [Magnetospirillum sp.]|nr:GntR family transcriptional regulator [Magnetospirillum sp.]
MERKQTRTEEVRRRLEDEILAGVHAPGIRLDEAEQSARLGCSRTPLREAFNQLVALGLLVRRTHCGVFVAPRDVHGLGELREAFVELEALCASLAARRMPVAERSAVERQGSDWTLLRASIRQACGNGVLVQLAQSLGTRLGYCGGLAGGPPAEYAPNALEALTRAMAIGDGEAAASAMREGLLPAAPPDARSSVAGRRSAA